MIVIADSGSTKTDWRMVEGKQLATSYQTNGFNPLITNTAQIIKELQSVFKQKTFLKKTTRVHYYGAGCWDDASCQVVGNALSSIFPNAAIAVTNDLLAAARATCGTNPGVVGILGTGSNSCLFDGQEIVDNVSSLGYIIGDEGSGVHLGKKLLKHYFYRELPADLKQKLESQYAISKKELIENVYLKKRGNAYLASFAQFVIQEKEHPFIKQIVKKTLKSFLKRHLLKYKNTDELPVHFVGSIAFFLQEDLKKILQSKHLKIGKIIKQPIEDLIDYHLK